MPSELVRLLLSANLAIGAAATLPSSSAIADARIEGKCTSSYEALDTQSQVPPADGERGYGGSTGQVNC